MSTSGWAKREVDGLYERAAAFLGREFPSIPAADRNTLGRSAVNAVAGSKPREVVGDPWALIRRRVEGLATDYQRKKKREEASRGSKDESEIADRIEQGLSREDLIDAARFLPTAMTFVNEFLPDLDADEAERIAQAAVCDCLSLPAQAGKLAQKSMLRKVVATTVAAYQQPSMGGRSGGRHGKPPARRYFDPAELKKAVQSEAEKVFRDWGGQESPADLRVLLDDVWVKDVADWKDARACALYARGIEAVIERIDAPGPGKEQFRRAAGAWIECFHNSMPGPPFFLQVNVRGKSVAEVERTATTREAAHHLKVLRSWAGPLNDLAQATWNPPDHLILLIPIVSCRFS